MFPFTYDGTIRFRCTEAGGYEGNPWCAYEVNNDGTVNNWAYCELTEECLSKKLILRYIFRSIQKYYKII